METKYKEEYCKKLIEHMSQGFSYDSFPAEVNCGLQTLYDWEKRYPEWEKAKAEAFAASQKFYETRLIAKISGMPVGNKDFKKKEISDRLLEFALKTRFHKTWGEKKQIDHEVSIDNIRFVEDE